MGWYPSELPPSVFVKGTSNEHFRNWRIPRRIVCLVRLYQSQISAAVVLFSIIVQGLTIKMLVEKVVAKGPIEATE